jgi:hypothetical protein
MPGCFVPFLMYSCLIKCHGLSLWTVQQTAGPTAPRRIAYAVPMNTACIISRPILYICSAGSDDWKSDHRENRNQNWSGFCHFCLIIPASVSDYVCSPPSAGRGKTSPFNFRWFVIMDAKTWEIAVSQVWCHFLFLESWSRFYVSSVLNIFTEAMPQRNRLWETSRTPYAPVLGKYRPNGSYGSYQRVLQPVIPDPPAICLKCENRGRLSPGPSSDTWG